jgi:hypothetical protein
LAKTIDGTGGTDERRAAMSAAKFFMEQVSRRGKHFHVTIGNPKIQNGGTEQ